HGDTKVVAHTLKDIEKDKAHFLKTSRFNLEIYYGKPYYQLDQRATSLTSSHQVGKNIDQSHIKKTILKISKLYLEIHILSRAIIERYLKLFLQTKKSDHPLSTLPIILIIIASVPIFKKKRLSGGFITNV
ncbi:hypothetical protein ACJX0J_033881, partial [Zea mays]